MLTQGKDDNAAIGVLAYLNCCSIFLDCSSVERKRIIIAQLFKRIEMERGYKLRFELDWNYQQFLEGAGKKQSNLIAVLGGAAPPKVKKASKITGCA